MKLCVNCTYGCKNKISNFNEPYNTYCKDINYHERLVKIRDDKEKNIKFKWKKYYE